ncbi:mandelate racemase/muconate lactonizing enzyme family protein [Acetobacter conturbans]|uniref:Mandelate racemase n=1 Tax=Acetobacter conturbans TaxID=1737472 RepID=A0ABX0K210_9PROT|nr:enolase C-terminal domain-like protein [Acetobacter conturbans]NHN89777.1 mandelate racemase [Acetobacter conturbans]
MIGASLRRSDLHYSSGMAVHTSSSGAVSSLDELYLILDDGTVQGLGEVRLNIQYLTGHSPEAIICAASEFLRTVIFPKDDEGLMALTQNLPTTLPSSVRMLVDIAIHDLVARRKNISVCALTGSGTGTSYKTNQTLFFSDIETFRKRCETYVQRGFTALKIRIGNDPEEDIAKFRWVRDRFHDDVDLAADANGAWSLDQASHTLDRLAAFNLEYIEQPLPAACWGQLPELTRNSPVPVMLDESLSSFEDCLKLAESGLPLMAHLKLVKLGGLSALAKAAAVLSDAGVDLMIGQMNEGGAATAAALQASIALRPRFAELYGADGLRDDPAIGLNYDQGEILIADTHMAGLGISFDISRTSPLTGRA